MSVTTAHIQYSSNIASLLFGEEGFKVVEKDGRIFSVQISFVDKEIRGISSDFLKRSAEIGSFVIRRLQDSVNPESYTYSIGFLLKAKGGGVGPSSQGRDIDNSSSFHVAIGSRSVDTSTRNIDHSIPDMTGRTFDRALCHVDFAGFEGLHREIERAAEQTSETENRDVETDAGRYEAQS